MIQAIETVYNGYRFRSRLEARWAVFFDAAGIKYQYEPEGFTVDLNYGNGDSDIINYLPDFYLPDFGCYVEVKPSKDRLFEDERKLNAMIDFGGPMADGLLILGQIPPVIDYSIPSFIKFYHHEGVVADLVAIEPRNVDRYGIERKARLWTVDDCIDCTGGEDLPLCNEVGEDLYSLDGWINTTVDGKYFVLTDYENRKIVKRLNECFDKARQARFEHGEKP